MTRTLIALLLLVAMLATGAEPLTRYPAAERIVAMADWHGDLAAARKALRLAGAIDDRDRWIAGDLVLVQTGDQLDRGDDEQAILDLLDRLEDEAATAGGAVHVLLGNHELMNVAWDFRYVTDGGWLDFQDAGIAIDLADTALAKLPPEHRARAAAFRPGGEYALQMADRNVAVIIGRDLFVHGGLLPAHLEYGLERINRETRAWLRGEAPEPAIFQERDSPIWARHYSDDPDHDDCTLLEEVLADLDCDRMFMGHTVQEEGVAAYCDQRAWCLDTGASAHYGGTVQVVEITAGSVRVRW